MSEKESKQSIIKNTLSAIEQAGDAAKIKTEKWLKVLKVLVNLFIVTAFVYFTIGNIDTSNLRTFIPSTFLFLLGVISTVDFIMGKRGFISKAISKQGNLASHRAKDKKRVFKIGHRYQFVFRFLIAQCLFAD